MGVTLAGLLNLTSTADSSALLTANLTASETESGRTLMYTDATADYSRHREVRPSVQLLLSRCTASLNACVHVSAVGLGDIFILRISVIHTG